MWPKGLSANAICTDMLLCMVTSVLRDQQYMFGVISLLVVEKVLMKNDLTTSNQQPASYLSGISILQAC